MDGRPLLLPKLEAALSSLYGDVGGGPSAQQNRREAHEFLLALRSCNVRRSVSSLLQSQKDRNPPAASIDGAGDGDCGSLAFDHPLGEGSVFLAAMALVLRRDNGDHERIFAAQTINHRCRSIKLAEALDIEAEDGIECGVARLVLAWEDLRLERARANEDPSVEGAVREKSRVILTAWMERYVPILINRCGGGGARGGAWHTTLCDGAELLGKVLHRHYSSLLGYVNDPNGEDRIKGTLIMLSLSVAIYSSAFREYEEEQSRHHHLQMQQQQQASPWANSVLSDLGSALSITAVRIRYRPTNSKYASPDPEPSCPSLIDMMVNSINLVKESAEAYFLQMMQHHPQNHHSLQTAIQNAHGHAVRRSVAACLRALPETVLLPPGQDDGGHRVPSVDRACLRSASMELRCIGANDGSGSGLGTGIAGAWRVLVESEQSGSGIGDHAHDASALRLLECCEAWSRFVAVPTDVIEASVGSLAIGYLHLSRARMDSPQWQKAQTAAFQYLISIFESASPSLTPKDILTASLGLGAGGHRGKGKNKGGGQSKKNANTKKKQGNKSRKRNERRLGRAIAGEGDGGGAAEAAEDELLARRQAACLAAAHAFGVSLTDGSTRGEDWGLRAAAIGVLDSHGVWSTVSAAAASVLPHLLYLERGDRSEGDTSRRWQQQLFSAIFSAIQRMCVSANRDVRALTYEPLMIVHSSLNSAGYISVAMEQSAVDAICECLLALAASCGYPHGYFECLTEDNDEELEVERNDVRDVARSVCSLDSGGIANDGRKSPSILILERMVAACDTAARDSEGLPPETAVHILSSLAKPLNRLGKIYKEHQSAIGLTIMKASMLALGSVCDQLNHSFDTYSTPQILPLSRLALMGAASLSPMFSSLAEASRRSATSLEERETFEILKCTLLSSLRHSLLSTARIPELVAESSLSSTRYDIKGAMRGPGGEDHVGCIALLRFSHESEFLTDAIFEVYGFAILKDLSGLYQGLKGAELERAFGCDYGKGVTPISRRIILRVISSLALHSMNGRSCDARDEKAILHELVKSPLAELRSQKDSPFSAEKNYRVSEAAFDLSFFSPQIVAELFDKPSGDLEVMFECVVMGYSRLSPPTPDPDPMCRQWGRLRGAVHSVLRTCLKEFISDYSARIITALIKAECDAATAQCNQGPESGSIIFQDNVVGEEMVSAGVFIVLIKDCLERIGASVHQIDKCVEESRRCISVLKEVAPVVMHFLLQLSSEASSHVDPRPTMAEAWFLTAESLVSICRGKEEIVAHLACNDSEELSWILGESLASAMALICLKDLGTRKASPPAIQKGMSLDGPHTLAIETFLSESMLLGPSILSVAGKSISTAIQLSDDFSEDVGPIVLTACLLRGVSGALPPWAVEEAPVLFRSLYNVIGSDCDKFVEVLRASTTVKAIAPFGGIRAGELVAGRYVDVSNSHIESFLSQSKQVCAKGEWKKLKVILKATCGGKKKDSGFNLKPQFTSWECERL